MKSRMKVIVLIVVIVICSFAYAHIDKNNIIYDKNYDDSDYLQTGSLYNNTSMIQTFVCKETLMDGIRVKTVLIGEPEDVTIEYTITNMDTGEKYVGTAAASEMKNNKYYFFRLDQQWSGCAGKEFQFEITEKNATETKGVSFYFTPSAKANTTLSVKGNSTNGTIIMKEVTHRFDIETFVVLLICIAFMISFMRVLYKLFNK